MLVKDQLNKTGSKNQLNKPTTNALMVIPPWSIPPKEASQSPSVLIPYFASMAKANKYQRGHLFSISLLLSASEKLRLSIYVKDQSVSDLET